jgi:hypothetical protein
MTNIQVVVKTVSCFMIGIGVAGVLILMNAEKLR